MIVHLVTDRRRLFPGGSSSDAGKCLLRQARWAIAAGIDLIQIREREIEANELAELTAAIVRDSRQSRTRVVVNDRLDVALAAGADGVHLPSWSLPVAAVRRLAPPGFIIGRSVHDVSEVEASEGADYLMAGTMWPTSSKPTGHVVLGEAGLASLVRATAIPVIAIGGLTLERAADVARTGALGAAAIGLFIDRADVEGCGAVSLQACVSALRQRFDTSGSRS